MRKILFYIFLAILLIALLWVALPGKIFFLSDIWIILGRPELGKRLVYLFWAFVGLFFLYIMSLGRIPRG